MIKYLLVLIVLAQACHKTSKTDYKLLKAAYQTTYDIESLPKVYEWSKINNTNFLTYIRNQHIPIYCGSCWAQSSTAAISDRIKIMRNATFPDINLAP